MFSANENLALRQHKQRVVEYVESCIPEEALDMGTMVMAMQVSCKAPGCVPLETAIVIVFPKFGEELITGLPESCGGNYKTKVLRPMAEVTKEDVLEALPPEFPGGKKTMEKLCIQARDVMLGQITQLFADEDQKGRQLMAEYLQQCLQEYVDRDCTPPEWGEPFSAVVENDDDDENGKKDSSATPPLEPATKQSTGEESNPSPPATAAAAASESPAPVVAKGVTKTGNFVFKRPVDNDEPISKNNDNTTNNNNTTNGNTSSSQVPHLTQVPSSKSNLIFVSKSYSSSNTTTATTNEIRRKKKSSQSIMEQLGERQHASGVRRQGCPCCDPDNVNNLIDSMMGR